jgi:hypothetical protein
MFSVKCRTALLCNIFFVMLIGTVLLDRMGWLRHRRCSDLATSFVLGWALVVIAFTFYLCFYRDFKTIIALSVDRASTVVFEW